MIDYELLLPDYFDDYEGVLESKGCFSDAVMICDGNKYELNFYDPVRLGQTIEYELSSVGAFFEENVVVIRTVNRSCIEKAVEYLASSGGYKTLQKMD